MNECVGDLDARLHAAAAEAQHARERQVDLAGSFFFLAWTVGPAWAVALGVGGAFSGTVTGVMNTSASLVASVTPIVYGTLFGQGHWVAPFLVSTAVFAAGALVWLVLLDPEKSVVES
ncbi:MAG: hypothetical protein HYU37_22690 [Acidobacteria bacterium]|nr:hypothetical protein [Acidobacteriota bacterium]